MIYFYWFQDLDDDSEAEKLSPLLITDERSPDKKRASVAKDSLNDTDVKTKFSS